MTSFFQSPTNNNFIDPRTGTSTKLQPAAAAEIVYNSYAGVDIVAEIVIAGEGPVTLGELQTISYSIHRENTPVRFIGHTNVVGWLRGPRTIAGSLIFTNFNSYAFYRLNQLAEAINKYNIFPLADMLPPFDVVLTMANEYGSISKMRIFGINIVDEGGTFSIDDLISESTFTYMARGIQPMTSISNTLLPSAAKPFNVINTTTGA